MKTSEFFLSENFQFLVVKFSVYLNRRVFVMWIPKSSSTCAKSRRGIWSPLKHTIVSNDSVCGQRMPWSVCADAQNDLGLRCSHMPKDTFSHTAALLAILRKKGLCVNTGCKIHFRGNWYIRLIFRHFIKGRQLLRLPVCFPTNCTQLFSCSVHTVRSKRGQILAF